MYAASSATKIGRCSHRQKRKKCGSVGRRMKANLWHTEKDQLQEQDKSLVKWGSKGMRQRLRPAKLRRQAVIEADVRPF